MDIKILPWKKIRTVALSVLAGLVAISIVLIIFRSSILDYVISSKVKSFNENHNADVQVINPHFSGILTINFDKIIIKPIDNDTLVNIDNLKIKINPFRVLMARLSITKLNADRIWINVLRDSSGNNYTFLIKTKKKDESSASSSLSYGRRVERLLTLFFDILPSDIHIRQFYANLSSYGHTVSATIPKFDITSGEVDLKTVVKENDSTTVFRLVGDINTWLNHAKLKVYALNKRKASIPFIDYKFHAKIAFDTLAFGIDNSEYSRGAFQVSGSAMFNNLFIDHRKIAQKEVVLEKGQVDYVLNFGKDYVEVDSATVVNFNKLTFNPYAKYRGKPNRLVALSINKDYFPAQDLFSSLPDGIFSTVRGLEVNGELAYHLKFEADWNNLKDLVFESDLQSRNFSIKKFGDIYYPYINNPFQYTFYDNGVPSRTFSVGEDNPNYRNLESIPKVLQYAVMFSEDGNFFGHRGFLIDAFRASLIRNIQAGRFVRGGSTISMQLVKNIYLSRNKTIARKLEEALITWLIERQHLVSKNRMLEIYLNIIEWGPGVFGANEAAQFYFGKDVGQITPTEAIFMASIIPRPKKFYYSFSDSGTLRSHYNGYYSLIASKLLRNGIITQDEFNGIYPHVSLFGLAKMYLTEPIENPSDTLIIVDDLQDQEAIPLPSQPQDE